MGKSIGMLRLRVEQLIKATLSDKEQRDNALCLLGLIFTDYPDSEVGQYLVNELKRRKQVR